MAVDVRRKRGRQSKGQRIFFRKRNREVKELLKTQPLGNKEHLFQIVVKNFSKRDRNGRRDTVVVPRNGIRKKVDVEPEAQRRTLIKAFRNAKAAMRWGRRYGTVVSCQKVDTSYYLRNIEFLNLEPAMKIEIETEEIAVGSDLSVEGRVGRGRRIEIELDDR